MDKDNVLPRLEINQLSDAIKSMPSAGLSAITLVSGDIFFGEIHMRRIADANSLDIVFNFPDGKLYGGQILRLPLELIASLENVPLTKETTHGYLPHNYGNPLATIIYQHNMALAEKYGLDTNIHLIEEMLGQEGIPTEGIRFDDDILLLADWGFFLTQASGETSVAVSPLPGLMTIEKSVAQALEQQVIQRLRANLPEKVRKITTHNIGEYGVFTGALLVPDTAQDTDIEGEPCHLYRIANSDDDFPVLVKIKQLKYPKEFLNRISSPVTCYGELMPIPVNILGKQYSRTLLVRAMAYLASKVS